MSAPPVLTRIHNGIGQITLNRPDALHALNLDMCDIINSALARWSDDSSVHVVAVDHAEGSRGFCAGGDIRMLAQSGRTDGKEARAFFASEYRMNIAIKEFPKPFVAFIDGITMGGGVGLSVHGSHRIATEHTVFAMPETGIGLFPDVGGGWFLPRLYGELGTWIALTGARLKGSDVKAAGIATHFVPSELLGNLKAQFLNADYSHGAAEMLGEVLRSRSHPVPAPAYVAHLDVINRGFAFDDLGSIFTALNAETSEWAHSQLAVLRTKSPLSMAVALRQIRLGAKLQSFRENMAMEYRIGARMVRTHDFSEGVRAVIEDKDNQPQWDPGTIEKLLPGQVDQVFAPLSDDEFIAL